MVGERNKTCSGFVLIIGTIIFLIVICPSGLGDIYIQNYIVDSFCLVISEILLLKLYMQNRLDIFEPITIISLVYIMMYFVTPIYDLCVGDFLWYGYDLFQYGVKSTLIAFAGYLTFYVCYTVKFRLGAYGDINIINSDIQDVKKTGYVCENKEMQTTFLIPFILMTYILFYSKHILSH